jgi:DNA-binding MarR family transcriptional regulator
LDLAAARRRSLQWIRALTDAKHHLPTTKRLAAKTITLSSHDLEEARRLLQLLVEGGEEDLGPAAGLARRALEGAPKHHEELVRKARQILQARQRRAEWFGKAIFGEPAWEMLLLLYATTGARRQTASRLADLAPASKATALRWLDYLVDHDLVERQAHPTDKRVTFVELTGKGREMLEGYLVEMDSAG